MTFYGILFSVLFLASFRELGVSLTSPDSAARIPLFLVICIFVFNDMLFTSHVVEPSPARDYMLGMKFVDLGNFILLSAALVATASDGNLLSIPRPACLVPRNAEALFWAALTLYWALCLTWSWLAGRLPLRGGGVPTWIAIGLLLVPLAGFLLVLLAKGGAAIEAYRWIAVALVTAYVCAFKPLTQRTE